MPELIVPDNPKTGVIRACRYDPDLNPTYQEWARHYGVGVLPARPGKPKDKAKVENGVLVAANAAGDMGGDKATKAALKAVLLELAPPVGKSAKLLR